MLILRDVLGWPAGETAGLLETSVASVKSALQRARATMQRQLPTRRLEWASSATTQEERALVERYMAATERADMAALAGLLAEDVRHTMPPEPILFEGRLAVIEAWTALMVGPQAWGRFRLLPARANRQPAVANYLRRPGDTSYRAFALDVLRIEDGKVVEVTAFALPELFPAFGLPPTL